MSAYGEGLFDISDWKLKAIKLALHSSFQGTLMSVTSTLVAFVSCEVIFELILQLQTLLAFHIMAFFPVTLNQASRTEFFFFFFPGFQQRSFTSKKHP